MALLLIFGASAPFIFSLVNGLGTGISGTSNKTESSLTERNTTIKETTVNGTNTGREVDTTTIESHPLKANQGPLEIPNSYLIWVGIIVAVLLIPQLKSAVLKLN